MIVIYTGDIARKEVSNEYSVGALKMMTETAFLSELDGAGILKNLTGKVHRQEMLTDEELMQLIILPLSYQKREEKEKRIQDVVELAVKIQDSRRLCCGHGCRPAGSAGLLAEMVRIIESGEYDSVATRRVDRAGEPPIRSFFARMFYHLMNKISDIDIVDGARDYRLMKRVMADAVVEMGERNRFSKGIFGWIGFSTYWLEFQNVERAAAGVSCKRLINQII